MIPLVNLKAQYEELKNELNSRVSEVMGSCSYINGRESKAFASEFLNAQGLKFGFGCANGTSALSIALRTLGVGFNDEVITVANTFIATAEAICSVGAKPVFADVEEETLQMNVSSLEKLLTKNTKAVIAVHLFGTPCDIKKLQKFCKEKSLYLIEDCAQAHLAKFDGEPVGSLGAAATFSFYPGKNLGAYGDAGFIAFQDEELAKTAKMMADHGRDKKYEHSIVGENSRLDEIQAAVLRVKLKHLSRWTDERVKKTALYRENLKGAAVKGVSEPVGAQSVYHLFPILISNRDAVVDALKNRDIQTGIHYPVPLHLQKAFSYLGYKPGDLPMAERAAEMILSLPMCPYLADEKILDICEVIKKVAKF